MSGALIDLVSKGIQDTYLTGNADTTFFRQTYKRHTNFSMEPVLQVVEGEAVAGGWSEIKISRSGDLLKDVFFLSSASGDDGINCPFEKVQLYIGGQLIDTLTEPENVACAQTFGTNNSVSNLTSTVLGTANSVHALQFFFARSAATALPLCALQYHEVSLRIRWKNPVVSADVYAEYIQLDTAERNSFARTDKPLNILIEQHQRSPIPAIPVSSTGYADVNFSHPVKAIYISFYDPAGTEIFTFDSFMKIEFNGKQRTPLLPSYNYFTKYQVGRHTEFNSTGGNFALYSFALFANRLTPTGSCNFSRLDNTRLFIQNNDGAVAITGASRVFALNWNILSISKGTGGLLFAN